MLGMEYCGAAPVTDADGPMEDGDGVNGAE